MQRKLSILFSGNVLKFDMITNMFLIFTPGSVLVPSYYRQLVGQIRKIFGSITFASNYHETDNLKNQCHQKYLENVRI